MNRGIPYRSYMTEARLRAYAPTQFHVNYNFSLLTSDIALRGRGSQASRVIVTCNIKTCRVLMFWIDSFAGWSSSNQIKEWNGFNDFTFCKELRIRLFFMMFSKLKRLNENSVNDCFVPKKKCGLGYSLDAKSLVRKNNTLDSPWFIFNS